MYQVHDNTTCSLVLKTSYIVIEFQLILNAQHKLRKIIIIFFIKKCQGVMVVPAATNAI
jgi:hypothetical protein